jgi:hypothetical protein
VTASELAFLGLGLLLGAATGAALMVVLDARPPRREIRVTVARDAVPRRSETLSQDAFVTSPSEPARGGPADRRSDDRPASPAESGPWVGVPVMAPLGKPGAPRVATEWAPIGPPDRTVVPNRVGSGAAVATAEPPEAVPQAPATVAAPPEAMNVPVSEPEPLFVAEAETLPLPPLRPSQLERILRGEHLAMVEVVDAVAGQDGQRRRDWELLLGGLVEAMSEMAVRESVVDFPLGTPFWDSFTVEQCRHIVGALASMGFQYDGHSGWVEHHVPVYRDLSIALADIGVDPIRIRAWPNQAEISALFAGARPAPEELLAAAGPDYRAGDMQALLGDRAEELAGLWNAWDEVRPALLAA